VVVKENGERLPAALVRADNIEDEALILAGLGAILTQQNFVGRTWGTTPGFHACDEDDTSVRGLKASEVYQRRMIGIVLVDCQTSFS
jgi:hypothetical protein